MAKKTKRIKELDILGMKVSVTYPPVVDLGGVQVAGVYYPEKCEIHIATQDRDETQIWSTLFHEICHAVFFRVGIHNTSVNQEVEEIIVDNIATVLVENFNFKV